MFVDVPDIMCQEYAIPDLSEQPSMSAYGDLTTPLRPPPPLHNFLPKPPPVPPPPEQYYTAAEILPAGPILTPCSPGGKMSSLFMLPLSPELELGDSSGRDDDDEDLSDISKFPKEDLILVEDFGEWQFGGVQLYEAPMHLVAERGGCCQFVSVYFGKLGQVEFLREVRALVRLNDTNVARLLGACFDCEPVYAVREYCEFGDLCQFLQDHVVETTTPRPINVRTLR